MKASMPPFVKVSRTTETEFSPDSHVRGGETAQQRSQEGSDTRTPSLSAQPRPGWVHPPSTACLSITDVSLLHHHLNLRRCVGATASTPSPPRPAFVCCHRPRLIGLRQCRPLLPLRQPPPSPTALPRTTPTSLVIPHRHTPRPSLHRGRLHRHRPYHVGFHHHRSRLLAPQRSPSSSTGPPAARCHHHRHELRRCQSILRWPMPPGLRLRRRELRVAPPLPRARVAPPPPRARPIPI